MALTEANVDDKIEVVGEHKAVQIRTARVIYDDGSEISRSFSRRVLHPSTKSGDTWSNTDISGESAEIQGICNAVWTDAVRTAYQNAMDAQGD
jgi:virulence-associated protein VagC